MLPNTPKPRSHVPASPFSPPPVEALELPAAELAARLAEVSDDCILCTNIAGKTIYAVTLGAISKLVLYAGAVVKALGVDEEEEDDE